MVRRCSTDCPREMGERSVVVPVLSIRRVDHPVGKSHIMLDVAAAS